MTTRELIKELLRVDPQGIHEVLMPCCVGPSEFAHPIDEAYAIDEFITFEVNLAEDIPVASFEDNEEAN